MIDMAKKYQTKSGLPVRLFCTDRNHEYRVVGMIIAPQGKELIYCWDANGKGAGIGTDLIEVGPYFDWPIDAKVWVCNGGIWVPGHFAGISPNGCPLVWVSGTTSFTAGPGPGSKAEYETVRLASEFTP